VRSAALCSSLKGDARRLLLFGLLIGTPGAVAADGTKGDAARSSTGEPAPGGYSADGQTLASKLSEARRLYVGGRFYESALLMEQVCAVSTDPVHLFNLGTANRRAGRASEAITSYRRFMEAAPQHPQVPEARAYIHDMEVLLQERQKAEQAASQLSSRVAWTEQALDEAKQALAKEREQREKENRPLYKKAWFWGVIASVVVAGTVGAVVGGVVSSQQVPLPPADTPFVDFSFK